MTKLWQPRSRKKNKDALPVREADGESRQGIRTYYHAVGFAVGLTAVVLLSAVNGVFLAGSHFVFGWDGRAYALVWLLSYLLTAGVFGEYVVNASVRKRAFLPGLFVVFTALLFWATYREESAALGLVFCLLALACAGWMLADMIKHAFYACFFCLPVIGWYAFLGLNLVRMLAN